jgi:hypothetical protein
MIDCNDLKLEAEEEHRWSMYHPSLPPAPEETVEAIEH